MEGLMGKGLRRQRLETRTNIKGAISRPRPNSSLGKYLLIISQLELNFYRQDTWPTLVSPSFAHGIKETFNTSVLIGVRHKMKEGLPFVLSLSPSDPLGESLSPFCQEAPPQDTTPTLESLQLYQLGAGQICSSRPDEPDHWDTGCGKPRNQQSCMR